MPLFGPKFPKIDLAGAEVLITGAGRGIGRAAAASFARRDARVHIADLDVDAARSAAAEIGGRAVPHALDVGSRASWEALIGALGRVDVLVNNAGVMPARSFLEETDEVIATTLAVNVWGQIHGMRTVVPQMLDRGRGHVVNVASLAGKLPIAGLAVYNASKFGSVGLSAAARLEFAPHGVSVSTVLPAAVRTALAAGITLGGGLPTVDPEDVAEVILDSCASRKPELTVPTFLGPLDIVVAAAPEWAVNLARTVIRGNRAMEQGDSPARAGYNDRIAAQARFTPLS